MLERRTALEKTADKNDVSLQYARQFAEADVIVIAAPYWDLSFPSILRAYIERINVNGITFCYSDNGGIKSLCRAKKLVYITTAGGFVFEPHMGYEYIKKLAECFFLVLQNLNITRLRA